MRLLIRAEAVRSGGTRLEVQVHGSEGAAELMQPQDPVARWADAAASGAVGRAGGCARRFVEALRFIEYGADMCSDATALFNINCRSLRLNLRDVCVSFAAKTYRDEKSCHVIRRLKLGPMTEASNRERMFASPLPNC